MSRLPGRLGMPLLALGVFLIGCGPRADTPSAQPADLVGAWHSHVRFRDGALASIADLEFLYVFNAGGTLTESSNYDGAPPVPPAYGVWLPSGRGVLTERIRLSDDGRSSVSTLRLEMFDSAGAPADGGGDAEGRGTRIPF